MGSFNCFAMMLFTLRAIKNSRIRDSFLFARNQKSITLCFIFDQFDALTILWDVMIMSHNRILMSRQALMMLRDARMILRDAFMISNNDYLTVRRKICVKMTTICLRLWYIYASSITSKPIASARAKTGSFKSP